MTVTPPLDPGTQPSEEWDMVAVKWLGRMFDGSVSDGELTLKIDRKLPLLYDDPTSPVSILPTTIKLPLQLVTLADGREYMYAGVNVPASDDPDIVGTGFTYTASIKLSNGVTFGPYTFTVPYTTPGGVLWLNRVANATPTPGEALPQITKAEFDAAVARIEALELGGGGGPSTFDASAIVTGRLDPARLGTGTASSATILYGDGSWKTAPTGSQQPLPDGLPVVRYSNVDGTWPTGLPVATAAAPVILVADLTNFPDATGYPAPPVGVRNKHMIYVGPDPITVMPTVVASVTETSGRAVTFHSTPSPTPGTSVVSTTWTFSGGGTAAGADVTHVFATTGTKTATVAVLDSNGLTATGSVTVTVTEGAPTVQLSYTNVGLAVTWRATGLDPEGEQVTLKFTGPEGLDATVTADSGVEGSTVKTYGTMGTKTASVTATDSKGLVSAPASLSISLIASDSNGVFTSDTFTGAAADAAAFLARPSDATLGGTAMTPAYAAGAISIVGGQLSLTTGGNASYSTGASHPKMTVTVPTLTATAVARFRPWVTGVTDYMGAYVKGNGEIKWEFRQSDPTLNVVGDFAAAGAFVAGDTLVIDVTQTDTTVVHKRGATVQNTYTVARALQTASSQNSAFVQDGASGQNAKLSSLIIGEVKP